MRASHRHPQAALPGPAYWFRPPWWSKLLLLGLRSGGAGLNSSSVCANEPMELMPLVFLALKLPRTNLSTGSTSESPGTTRTHGPVARVVEGSSSKYRRNTTLPGVRGE